GNIAPAGAGMSLLSILVMIGVSVVVGMIFAWLSVPAPLLMGAMVVSAIAHLTGLETGVLPGWLTLVAYLVLGSLIGTRFSGITP
ncbi:AbrB family transcriptional regulator, partial [Sulfitobacter sp. 15WGC]